MSSVYYFYTILCLATSTFAGELINLNYLILKLKFYYPKGLPSVCPPILTRKEWGGETALQTDYAIFPLQYVIIHHTVTNICETKAACSEIVRSIQDYHINVQEFGDIGYKY